MSDTRGEKIAQWLDEQFGQSVGDQARSISKHLTTLDGQLNEAFGVRTRPKTEGQRKTEPFAEATRRADPFAEATKRDHEIEDLLRWLQPNQNLPTEQRQVATRIYLLAREMAHSMPSSPQMVDGLRHLLKAKDCFVRASLGEES